MSHRIEVKQVVKIRPKSGKPSAATPASPWFAIFTDGVQGQCLFAIDGEAWKENRRFLTEGSATR